MGLEQVKQCTISFKENKFVISGICKVSNKRVRIELTSESYFSLKGGMPIAYAAPYLSREEIEFLSTGIWRSIK